MTLFRPCIDLHAGQVKQIVGGTLSSNPSDVPPAEDNSGLKTNHISPHPASFFSRLYREHGLRGGHVILLGPGNEDEAMQALEGWPGGLQVGGGVSDVNARAWIQRGAEKVIVTSFLFPNTLFSQERLDRVLTALGGDKSKLVIDLSCRRHQGGWVVAMDKWTKLTSFEITAESIAELESYCSEFLIHAADNEGLQSGVDVELVQRLGEWCSIPVTYAGGAREIGDLAVVKEASKGKVDLTIGSALDIFGGRGVTLQECVAWNQRQRKESGETGAG